MSLPTLYALPVLNAVERAPAARVRATLLPFCTAGVLGAFEVHTATALARSAGEWDPTVILLAALALRAPAHGHICLDLHPDVPWPRVDRGPQAAGRPDAADALAWPDRADARRRLARSLLVHTVTGPAPGATAAPDAPAAPALKPRAFTFDGRRLYTQRHWTLQARVATALRARLAAPPALPADPTLLQRGLDLLFPAPDLSSPMPGGPAPEPAPRRQQFACALAALRSFTVITGGPGTGKTTTVLKLLALAFAQDALARRGAPERPPLAVALAAPTGKAAARVRESLAAGLRPEFCAQFDAAFGALLGANPSPLNSAGANPTVPASARFRAFIEALKPSTLHRLLGLRPGPILSARHGADHPLPCDLLVVDETSMVDFDLFARLVEALAPQTRLILLGDRHQLASVEAGSVLADLCGPVGTEALTFSADTLAALRAVLPTAAFGPAGAVRLASPDPARPDPAAAIHPGDAILALTHSHRFVPGSPVGPFVRACLAPPAQFSVEACLQPLDPTRGDPGEGAAPPPALVALAVAGYRPMLQRIHGTPGGEVQGSHLSADGAADPWAEARQHREALDLLGRFRVLCAHRRGPLGVEAVNRAVVAGLNEAGLLGPVPLRVQGGAEGFWIGRPVLITRNDPATRRYNGDIGLVVWRTDADGRRVPAVAFPGPEPAPPPDVNHTLHAALTQIPRPGDPAPTPIGRWIEYVSPARLPPHETTFAMTIHKSQGSEFEGVAVVLGREASPLVTRELVYTGVTRAKQAVHVFAHRWVLAQALRTQVQRASGLGERLWGAATPDAERVG